MDKTFFLVAMEYERKNIFSQYHLTPSEDKSLFATFETDKFVVVETGIGKSNSAAATQYVLDKFSPRKIVNIGLAGSLTSKHNKGDVVEIGKSIFHDVDVRGFGYKLGQIPETEIYEYRLNSDSDVVCLTGDIFLQDTKRLAQLKIDFPMAEIIEMELASIAHVLYRHNKLERLSAYKIISDGASDGAENEFYDQEKLMFEKAIFQIDRLI